MTAQDIQAAVAEWANVGVADLTGPARHQRLADVRAIAIYLCRRLLDMSFPALGRAFDRDHTTCIHAFRRVQMTSTLLDWAMSLRLRLQLQLQLAAPLPSSGPADPEEVMA